MWWPPRNDRERSLARATEQVRDWFRDQPFLGRESVSWGFGTAWSEQFGGLVPLVLLNEERFPHPFLTVAEEALLRRGRIEPVPIELLLNSNVGVQFPRTDPPLHYFAVGQPRASSVADELFNTVLCVRNPIVCGRTGEMGTAGVVVCDRAGAVRYLLTAGHVFPEGVGSPVRQARWRFFPRWRTRPFGEVIRHVVPNGTAPGWDAAVIRVDKRLPLGVRVVRNQVRHFERVEAVVAYGAFSGLVRNAVTHGGLEVLEGKDYKWKNCWMTGPTGILTNGDSGAAVFTRRQRKFLGVYIGQSTVGGASAFHYVQDSYTLEQEVLTTWNVEF